MIDALTITSAPGVELEAELAGASAPRVGMVLCHPHPQYGGTMRSIVIGALFDALPRAGATALRFNFRGVGRSTGTYDAGRGEADDARAALAALQSRVDDSTPIVLAGWSFGGDVALSVLDDSVAAWVAIAPPLRFADAAAVGADPRPKLLLLGERDEVRPPDDVLTLATTWTNTEVHVIPGASHFFVGRTDHVVSLTVAFLARLTA